MPLSLFSLFLGFVLGVAATGIAWSMAQRTVRPAEKAKVTALWNIRDIVEPGHRAAIVAEHLDQGVHLPPQSKLIVPASAIHAVPQAILQSCEVRMHPDVRLNAAIGKDRALLFSGHVSPKAHAMVTTEPSAVRRLQNDFERMWGESSPYVERVAVSELATKDGRHVDVTGRAMDVLEYRGKKMLRLTDNKAQVGVVTSQGDVAQWAGTNVRVIGKMHRDGGHSYIEADRVMPVGEARSVAP
ncbi:MAG TPA: hypothetical protein VM582_01030 [Candidatus Thermoplasmatota archaeon]|nr:hypothetical protein [Candidatus Thermoplasmatota archaeon]